jgi:hypothetical protein
LRTTTTIGGTPHCRGAASPAIGETPPGPGSERPEPRIPIEAVRPRSVRLRGAPRFNAFRLDRQLAHDEVKRRADEPTAGHTLYNLIDRRHGQVSTAVTSNIALSEWGRYLGTPP